MTSISVFPGTFIIGIIVAFIIATEIASIFTYPVYKKANATQAWFAFIPFINVLPMLSIAKMSRWWILLILGLQVATIASDFGSSHRLTTHMSVAYYVFTALSFAFSVYMTGRVFKAFGVPNWVVWTLLIFFIADLLTHISSIVTIIASFVILACAVILLVYWCRMAWGKFYYDPSRLSSRR